MVLITEENILTELDIYRIGGLLKPQRNTKKDNNALLMTIQRFMLQMRQATKCLSMAR